MLPFIEKTSQKIREVFSYVKVNIIAFIASV